MSELGYSGGEGAKMPLLDHLVELRQRLLYSGIALLAAFLVCFYFAEPLFAFLADPLLEVLEDQGQDRKLIYTHLLEVFITDIKVAFFFGAFFSCPIFLAQFWLFVAPGLYKSEKMALAPFLVFSPLLFFMGGALVYYIIMPLAWEFFATLTSNNDVEGMTIELLPKVNEYFSLVMTLIFVFGLCFQLPIVMTLLARVGLATSKGMARKRKYAVVGVFIVAAVFTPPDPISQISLAIPIVLLYEISIYMAKLVEKKRPADEYDDDDEDDEDDTDEAKES